MSALEVLAIGPSVTAQSAPREGLASLGVPASGAADREAMRAALSAVGGEDDDAVIELPLYGARFRAHGDVMISLDGASPVSLVDGESWSLPVGTRAVRYLAIRGGLDLPMVLGARGTCLPGRFGGFEGRALRRGDVLAIGSTSRPLGGCREDIPAHLDEPLNCIPTARGSRELGLGLELIEQRFTVDSRSDRVGTRLHADSLPLKRLAETLRQGSPRSRPTLRGAIQLPPDGRPIVLGPDGPTVGGYPVVAVLERAACDLLARRRPGDVVTFRLASLP